MTIKLKTLKQPILSTTNKDSNADYTGDGNTPQRVMFLNLYFFKYGTNDKAHGAAIVLALVLIILMALVYFFGDAAQESQNNFMSWIGNAFLFVSGVAVGKGSNKDDQ